MKRLYMLGISVSLLISSYITSIAQNIDSPATPYYLGNSTDLLKELNQQSSKARIGDPAHIQLKISANKAFSAKINYNHPTEIEGQAIAGEIENIPGSSFYIVSNGKSLEGNILLPKSKQAFKYHSDQKGNAYVTEVDINGVICIDYRNEPSENKSQRVEGTTKTSGVPVLESLPGAKGCVLLDFDGYYYKGYSWNGGNPIDAQPSPMNADQIKEAWELTSEDYRPFNLNFTTSEAVFNTYPANRRTRCVITPTNTASPGSGGVSYIGVFGSNYEVPSWVFMSGGKGAGEAISHELGHTFGLNHDGRTTPKEEYYGGQGNWGPIMGVGYYKGIIQFSKGEYANASNTSDDDLLILSRVGVRADDHGNTIESATTLNIDGTGNLSATQNFGLIESTTDADVFSFYTAGGSVVLNLNPAARHGNLDISATLYNATGSVISTSNPTGLAAKFTTELAEGLYYVKIEGSGEGNPVTDGYSKYASLGYFSITGNIPPLIATRIYQNCAYADGFDINLDPGNYTTAKLLAKGILDNDASALKVTKGYEVVLYTDDNFKGKATVFSSDDDCLKNNGINDSTSSIRVRSKINRLPGVSIVSPIDKAIFTVISSITVTVNASDADGSISKVELFNGNTKIGQDNQAPYLFPLTGLTAGTLTLTAKATDDRNGQSTSLPIEIKINNVLGAIVYRNCKYIPATDTVELAVGKYTKAQLNARGLQTKDISALKVKYGFEVVVYEKDNFEGSAYILRTDVPCLATTSINKVDVNLSAWPSSIIVRQVTAVATVTSTPATIEFHNGEDAAKSIAVSPNPFVDYIKIQFDNAIKSDVNIQLFNDQSKLILTLVRITSGQRISLPNLERGVYFLRIQMGNQTIDKRLIKY